MKRAVIISIIAAAGLGLAVFILLSTRTDGDEPAKDQRRTSRNPDRLFQEPALGSAGDVRVRASEVLADYKKWAMYPPWSRPMNKLDTDYINHRVIELPFRALFHRDKKGRVHHTSLSCRLQPATHTVTEGATQKIILACYKGSPDSGPFEKQMRDLRITGHSLLMVKPAGPVRLPSTLVTFNDAGKQGDAWPGDRKYTFIYKPGPADWGDMLLKVRFRLSGGDDDAREYELSAQFFSSPRAPARFTGRFTESADDGHLKILVRMKVRRAGLYRIQGNLRSEGRYIAAAKTEIKLKPGTHDVPLRFFGKILHDRNARGHYYLSGLRGFRRNDLLDPDQLAMSSDRAARYIEKIRERIEKDPNSVEPDRQVMPSFAGEYKTRVYTPADFSDREWTSRRKTEKIAALREMVAEEKRAAE